MATKADVLSIRVSPEEKEFVRQDAERQDISVSKLLYRILKKEYFDKENVNNENHYGSICTKRTR